MPGPFGCGVAVLSNRMKLPAAFPDGPNTSLQCRDDTQLQTLSSLVRLDEIKMKIKVQFTLEQVTKAKRVSIGMALLFLSPQRSMGFWSTPRSGRYRLEKDRVPIVYKAGWAPWPVWTGEGNLVHTGIRTSDRPARSESLYRLSYRGQIDVVQSANESTDPSR